MLYFAQFMLCLQSVTLFLKQTFNFCGGDMSVIALANSNKH